MDISKKNVRNRIPVGTKLHTRELQTGLYIGYRKGKTGGRWTAKMASAGHVTGYIYKALGVADDTLPADGTAVFSFDQANAKARTWWADQEANRQGEVIPGLYTVAMAVSDYLADQEARKGKYHATLKATRLSVAKHITSSSISGIHLASLTHHSIDTWFTDLSALKKPHNGSTEGQAIQRAQSTANMAFTNLEAGLNFAYRKGRVSTRVWERVKLHKGADVSHRAIARTATVQAAGSELPR
jgi:hypothetical protein